MLYDVEALVDGFGGLSAASEPAAQQARAHWRDGAVDDAEEFLPIRIEGSKSQGWDGEAVETHIFAGFYTADRCDMLRAGMLGEVKVVEDGACGYDGRAHAVDAEPLSDVVPNCLRSLSSAAVDVKSHSSSSKTAVCCENSSAARALKPRCTSSSLGARLDKVLSM